MASEKIISQCLEMVAPAETAFHSRWRMTTLKRVAPDLHEAINEQQDLYGSACVMGTDQEARMQSEAMVRGWAAACREMETREIPDDAFLMGIDSVTGIQVVIAEHKGSRDALAARYGDPLVMITPNEVAALLGAQQIIAEAKKAFTQAELVSLEHHDNPILNGGR